MSTRAHEMCPHCGEDVRIEGGLTVTHDWPRPTRQVCPGSGQYPRCARVGWSPVVERRAQPEVRRMSQGPKSGTNLNKKEENET